MDLTIKNLVHSYNNQVVLNIPDLYLENIHTLALIGPSGGGKSTLLSLLASIQPAHAEIFKVNQFDLTHLNTPLSYLKEVGFVFQSNNLFPHLSLLDNIALPLIYTYGLPKEEATSKAKTWLEKVDILSHSHKKPSQVSGGQAQRAAIARALVTGARLLLLDEPTSALDPKLAYEVMQTLLQIKKISDIIIVTHELNFAHQFADYYLFIEDGKILEHNQTSKLFKSTHPKVKEFVSMVSFK